MWLQLPSHQEGFEEDQPRCGRFSSWIGLGWEQLREGLDRGSSLWVGTAEEHSSSWQLTSLCCTSLWCFSRWDVFP